MYFDFLARMANPFEMLDQLSTMYTIDFINIASLFSLNKCKQAFKVSHKRL